MPVPAKKPNRQSIRLRGWDYTAPGWYFATFNTHYGKHLFGTIINGRMVLNTIGQIAAQIWQRTYWDVIVRDDHALANIRRYIRDNPRNYQAVMQGGTPRMLGNAELLNMPKLGFLASRGEPTLHGNLPLKSGEVIMSGFLSPMERALFRAGLKTGKPMIWVKPWGLAIDNESASVRRAIDAGRLLLLSPFDQAIEAPSARRAAWCNHYVVAHCQRLVIGHLNPEGMLACILSEASPDLEIIQLTR